MSVPLLQASGKGERKGLEYLGLSCLVGPEGLGSSLRHV